jgi:hypothetical protein
VHAPETVALPAAAAGKVVAKHALARRRRRWGAGPRAERERPAEAHH